MPGHLAGAAKYERGVHGFLLPRKSTSMHTSVFLRITDVTVNMSRMISRFHLLCG